MKAPKESKKEKVIKKKTVKKEKIEFTFCPSCGINEIISIPVSAKHKNKSYQLFGCINCETVFIA